MIVFVIHVLSCFQGVQHRMVLVVNLFVFFKIIIFCFVTAIFDQVHGVEAIFHLNC